MWRWPSSWGLLGRSLGASIRNSVVAVTRFFKASTKDLLSVSSVSARAGNVTNASSITAARRVIFMVPSFGLAPSHARGASVAAVFYNCRTRAVRLCPGCLPTPSRRLRSANSIGWAKRAPLRAACPRGLFAPSRMRGHGRFAALAHPHMGHGCQAPESAGSDREILLGAAPARRRAEPCVAQRDDAVERHRDGLPDAAVVHSITSYPVGRCCPYPHSACLR